MPYRASTRFGQVVELSLTYNGVRRKMERLWQFTTFPEALMSDCKQAAIEMINALPDDCTLDDIQYHLFVRRSVERGLRDIDEGRILTVDEMERRLGQWLTSFGLKKHDIG
jgi:hypothetical protein